MYRNPLIIIRKANGDFKAVQDFRKLNEILVDLPYSAEPINTKFDSIYESKYFVTCDFTLAYNQ